MSKVFHIRSLSDCAGCGGNRLADNMTARLEYLQEISQLGGIEKIPAPYRAWVETFEADTAPGFGAYKPVSRFENLPYVQSLFNALPGDLNPNKNTFVKGIYEMLPQLSAKLREAYFSITKDYFCNTYAVYFYLGIRGTAIQPGNKEAAFRKALEVFQLRLEHWNQSEKSSGATWWQSILAPIVSLIPYVGGFLSGALNLANFNSSGMVMTLPNGTTIDTTQKSGFGDIQTILIIGAGAGLLLSLITKKKRGQK